MKSYRVRPREHDDLLYDLLHARGVAGKEAQERFLTPDFERDSHDPMLLPDMEVAVERIVAAQKLGEVVCVWSDYDCDGIPGGVMLAGFLRGIGLNVIHYIPHRHEEGYGLNARGIDELAEKKVTLMITVDLGTTEHEHIAYAKEKGIDTIVTDHHLVSAPHAGSEPIAFAKDSRSGEINTSPTPPQESFAMKLPPALAVINPKRPDSKYPFDGLCGAGVAWKLVQGILATNRFNLAPGREKWLLDLVGIATLSDMVPLVGENRMLAHFGLRVMRRTRRPGLASLLSLLRIKPEHLTEDDIGFMVAPRINAASRMDKPDLAARLLATESSEEASALARALQALNDERKGVVAATVKEVNHRLKGSELLDASVLVMGNPKWRPGILGLVANTLVEAHGKPVFLWGREGGETIRGSARLPDGSSASVVEIMQGARGLFNEFGGHHASGGFSIEPERVHELGAGLARSYETIAARGPHVQDELVDRELALAEVPFALRDLTRLAPFGEGFAKPLFLFPRVQVQRIKSFGKAQDHLEAMLHDGFEAEVAGMSFFSTPESFSKPLVAGSSADIVGHVERDWRGRARIRIVDVV